MNIIKNPISKPIDLYKTRLTLNLRFSERRLWVQIIHGNFLGGYKVTLVNLVTDAPPIY